MISAGLRPFGVSLLYIGHDPLHGFQLYHSDPSGNYSGWKATCIGANNSKCVPAFPIGNDVLMRVRAVRNRF